MANLFEGTANSSHSTINVGRTGIGKSLDNLGSITREARVLNAKRGILQEKFFPYAKLVLFWFLLVQLYDLIPLKEKIYAISMVKIVGYYKDRGKPWKWRIFHPDHPFNAEVSK